MSKTCSTNWRDEQKAYSILVGKPDAKRSHGRLRRRWEVNIKIDIKETGYGDVDWIHLPQ
jgi:hypothetical protein